MMVDQAPAERCGDSDYVGTWLEGTPGHIKNGWRFSIDLFLKNVMVK